MKKTIPNPPSPIPNREMSLEIKNEEPESKESSEETKKIQPVEIITPVYTYLLVICIIAVTITQLSTDPELSKEMAGFDKTAFREKQEYWRILTGGALHGDAFHIFFNAYALFSFGRLVEILSNRTHLAIVFLLSVIGGGLLSLVFLPNGNSVGASGGIVGIIGYLAVYGYLRRALLSTDFLKNILINVGIIALIGIFVLPDVDNYGLLGGFLTGTIYGFFQIPKDLYQNPREVRPLTEGIGMIALGIFVFTSVLAILLILQFIKL
jgi:membrane associated rhomboid family serine protease